MIGHIQEDIDQFKDTKIKIKFVEKRNLHISLKFLGDLNSFEIQNTISALQKISPSFSPFTFRLAKKIDVFPGTGNPRVIWVGLEKGNREIERIYQAIELELRKETFYRSDKKFTPHITLGRIKFPKFSNLLIKHLDQIQVSTLSQKIHSIELMESHLAAEGPTYTVIRNFQFGNK